MNMGPLREEPTRLSGTGGQDRLIERPNFIRRHRLRLVALAAGAIALGALGLYLARLSGAPASADRARLSIATVERGSFVRDVVADGQVVAAVSPTLYASAAGTVTLKVHAGDTIAKGAELATIDSPDLLAKLSQEQSTLQSLRLDWQRATVDAARKLSQMRNAYIQAQVDQKTAQREFERSHKAYELGAYSELQSLKAQDALEKAQFTLDTAKMNYDSQPAQNRFDTDSKKALLDRQQYLVADLTRQVDSLVIRSPVDGQIGQVLIADRANVAKDAPLMTAVDLSALEVEIKVAENLARDLRSGMSADLQGDGRHWQGTVSGVSPEVVGGQVTSRLRFAEGRPAGLRQNQRLSVRILIDRRDNVLMVDRGSFLEQDGGHFAYVVRDNIATRRPVVLGAASIAKVEILEGLDAGDRVVISGSDEFGGANRVILPKE
jgi:HlyD family secretion protein